MYLAMHAVLCFRSDPEEGGCCKARDMMRRRLDSLYTTYSTPKSIPRHPEEGVWGVVVDFFFWWLLKLLRSLGLAMR